MRVIYSIFFAEFLQTVQQQFAKRFAERCCVELHEPLVKRRVSQSIGGKNTLLENIFLLPAICIFLFDLGNQKVDCIFFAGVCCVRWDGKVGLRLRVSSSRWARWEQRSHGQTLESFRDFEVLSDCGWWTCSMRRLTGEYARYTGWWQELTWWTLSDRPVKIHKFHSQDWQMTEISLRVLNSPFIFCYQLMCFCNCNLCQ